MTSKAEKLQDAIGLVKDEYVLDAHGELEGGGRALRVGEESEVKSGTDANDALHESASADEVSRDKHEAEETPAGGRVITVNDVTGSPRARVSKRSWRPIAVAACLALAVGIGLLGVVRMPISPMAADKPSGTDSPGAATAESAGVHGESAGSATADGSGGEAEADAAGAASVEVEDVESPLGVETATGSDDAYAPEALYDGEVEGDASYGETSSARDISGSEPKNLDVVPYPVDQGQAYVLTAAEWNDNENWPFLSNLVSAGTVEFPTFGIDPTHRVRVSVSDANGNPLPGQTVELLDGQGNTLWTAKSGKDAVAYLFHRESERPVAVRCNGAQEPLVETMAYDQGQQGGLRPAYEDVDLHVSASQQARQGGLQVMFIVDTTGSMADEITYLQADFASIARDVAGNASYSVNFYRDEGDDYVTRCSGFTTDVPAVQRLLNAEYAAGGGDRPEAVAQVLTETITDNSAWRDDCAKVAFLIFDAPPHVGTDAQVDAAVRSAAERGIRLVPVVASNSERDTELFGRALAICTNGTYVFLTDDSGVGNSHLEPIVGPHDVELLHDVIVRIINESR